MKNIQLYIATVVLAFSLGSCIKDSNPPIPAYIHVPSMEFILNNPATQGTASQKITDAWVSVNDQLIGTNNFPCTLPFMIPEDSLGKPLKISIRPGIENNGVSNKKYDYPFFEPYIEYRVLEQGKVDTVYPTTHYSAATRIILVDDFEGAGVQIGMDMDSSMATFIEKSTEDVFEGTYSGKIVVDTNTRVMSTATVRSYSDIQDANASAVYLELNYKTELPINIGIVSYKGADSLISIIGGVNPRDHWNKIYFNFTEKVYSLNADRYKVFLEVTNTSNKPDPKVYVDNIKLLHF